MKINPPTILATLAVVTLLTTSSGAWAQGGATPSPTPSASSSPIVSAESTAKAEPKRPMRERGNGFEALSKQLDLTPEQQAKIKPIMESQQEKIRALREDKTGDRKVTMAKVKTIREATSKEIEAELTPEQKAKYEAMKSKLQERRKTAGERGPGRGQDKAPATAGASPAL